MKEPRRRAGVKMIEEAKRSTRGLIMTEGKGVLVPNCPTGFKACYPSFQCEDCMFWRNGRCDYEATMAVEESVGQLGTVYSELSKR